MKQLVTLVFCLLIAATSQAAVYTWTGSANSDFFNESNWVEEGTTNNPPVGTINPETNINHDLVIASGTAAVNAASFTSEPYLGPGVGLLTMTGGVLDFIGASGNNGLAATVDGTDVDNCLFSMTGSALAQLQFVLDLDMTLADSATLELYGGGNPVNRSVINIQSADASIHFIAETPSAFQTEHLSKILVVGQPAAVGTNLGVLEPGDNLQVVSNGGSGCIVTAAPFISDPVALLPVPADGSSGIDPVAAMTWQVENADNPSCDINIGTDSNCNNILDDHSTGSVNSYTPPAGLLDYATDYFWRVDVSDGGIEYPGTYIWSFTTGGKAVNPVPAAGGVADRSVGGLSWSGDDLIASYDVWFGLPGNLQFVGNYVTTRVLFGDLATVMGQAILQEGSYQWRVDTRDSLDSLMVTGDGWDVIIPEITPIAIDDFEEYADTSDLLTRWMAVGGAALQYDSIYNFMRCDYSGVSEAVMNLSPAQNWIVTGMDTFSVSFLGNETNDAAGLALTISDGSTSATVVYPLSDAATNPWWRQWHIRLSEFSAAGLDLTHVTSVKISVSGGSGTLRVDDLSLEMPGCIAAFQPAGDLNSDCAITLDDVEMLADDWLLKNFEVTPAPANADLLLAHYEFEEVSGSAASDTSGNNHHAEVAAADLGAIWNASGYSGRCLQLDDSAQVTIPSAVLDSVTDEITIALWVNGDPADYPDKVNRAMFAAGAVAGDAFSWDQVDWALDSADAYGGQWNHYAAVKDINSGLMSLYRNGILVARTTGAAEAMEGTLAGETLLSMTGFCSWADSTVKIDDLRIYGDALSQDEIVGLAGGSVIQPIEPVLTEADLDDDGSVNLADFAIIAQQWLEQK